MRLKAEVTVSVMDGETTELACLRSVADALQDLSEQYPGVVFSIENWRYEANIDIEDWRSES